MTEDVFGGFIKRLHDYFDRDFDRVSANTTIAWLDRLDGVPDEAVPWIEDQIKMGSWPKDNFPAMVIALYDRYLELHPGAEFKTNGSCPDCEDGLLFVHRFENDQTHNSLFACGRCNRARCGENFPRATMDKLRREGWLQSDFAPGPRTHRRHKGGLEMPKTTGAVAALARKGRRARA
ncbi:MAG: hypothetical protein WAW37_05135 [Syntrophobacteraceae bacterium]